MNNEENNSGGYVDHSGGAGQRPLVVRVTDNDWNNLDD
jgi:hypothetical protein